MINLPIFILLTIALAFWLLIRSRDHWALKAAAVVLMMGYGLSTWFSLPSYFGWGAPPDNLYDKPVTIYYSVIKEPTETKPGGIWFMVDQPRTKSDSAIMRLFGFPIKSGEPREYRFPYTRSLHEEVVKQMLPSFKRGQPVQGKFERGKDGKGKLKGGEKGKGESGDGDESQDDGETHFHKLQPTEIQPKGPKKAVPLPTKKNGATLV